MNKKILFLLFLTFIPVVNATYYIDKTDNFENSNNVSVINNLLINTSIDVIHFNNSVIGSGVFVYEDTDDYTKVDVDAVSGSIDIINSTTVFMNDIDRDETEYNYLDKGIGYFDDYTCLLDISVIDYYSNPQSGVIAFTNSLGQWDSVGDFVGLKLVYLTSKSTYSLQLWKRETTNTIDYYDLGSSNDFNAWLNFTKSGNNCTVDIYSDSDMSVLLDTIYVTFSNSKTFRYINWGITDDDGLSGRSISYYINNIRYDYDLVNSGYFTTINLLNNTNRIVKTVLCNSTIPINAEINIQFSNNNNSWVNSNKVINGTDSLKDGYNAFNLEYLNYTDLYLNFSFTRLNSSCFNSLNNMSIIYETGAQTITYINVPQYESNLVNNVLPYLVVIVGVMAILYTFHRD